MIDFVIVGIARGSRPALQKYSKFFVPHGLHLWAALAISHCSLLSSTICYLATFLSLSSLQKMPDSGVHFELPKPPVDRPRKASRAPSALFDIVDSYRSSPPCTPPWPNPKGTTASANSLMTCTGNGAHSLQRVMSSEMARWSRRYVYTSCHPPTPNSRVDRRQARSPRISPVAREPYRKRRLEAVVAAARRPLAGHREVTVQPGAVWVLWV